MLVPAAVDRFVLQPPGGPGSSRIRQWSSGERSIQARTDRCWFLGIMNALEDGLGWDPPWPLFPSYQPVEITLQALVQLSGKGALHSTSAECPCYGPAGATTGVAPVDSVALPGEGSRTQPKLFDSTPAWFPTAVLELPAVLLACRSHPYPPALFGFAQEGRQTLSRSRSGGSPEPRGSLLTGVSPGPLRHSPNPHNYCLTCGDRPASANPQCCPRDVSPDSWSPGRRWPSQ